MQKRIVICTCDLCNKNVKENVLNTIEIKINSGFRHFPLMENMDICNDCLQEFYDVAKPVENDVHEDFKEQLYTETFVKTIHNIVKEFITSKKTKK